MWSRFFAALCVTVILAAALTLIPGPLTLSFRHEDARSTSEVSVARGRLTYTRQITVERESLLTPDQWRVALNTRPPANLPSVWAPPAWGADVGGARLDVPLIWLAAAAAFAIAAPRPLSLLRARRRMRRGACAACGYDLRAAGASCPECGAARHRDPAARRPLDFLPRPGHLTHVAALAGGMFFLLAAGLGAAASLFVAADDRAGERHALAGADVTRFVVATTPRLSGDVARITSDAGWHAPPGATRAGTLVLLDPGDHLLPPRTPLRDVAIVGQSPETTSLRLVLEDAVRVRLENLTIDCRNDAFLYLRRGGGTLSLRNCLVVNYFSADAGRPDAVAGSDCILFIDRCTFDGSDPRAANLASGNAFDLGMECRVYCRNTTFVANDSVCVPACVTYDACTFRIAPVEHDLLTGAVFFRASPTMPRQVWPAPAHRFEWASDDPRFVKMAVGAGTDGACDPHARRALDLLPFATDPAYWLALLRDPRPDLRAAAAHHLAKLGYPTRRPDPVTPSDIPALLDKLASDQPEDAREARANLAAAPPQVWNVALQIAAATHPHLGRKLEEVRRLRELAVPLATELEYARLAAEIDRSR